MCIYAGHAMEVGTDISCIHFLPVSCGQCIVIAPVCVFVKKNNAG